jgi:hypothetical protein
VRQRNPRLATTLAELACALAAFGLFLALAGVLSPSLTHAQSTLPADESATALPIYPAFKGDFDEMKKARLVRILVPIARRSTF